MSTRTSLHQVQMTPVIAKPNHYFRSPIAHEWESKTYTHSILVQGTPFLLPTVVCSW